MARSYEMTLEINGAVDRSLGSAFQRANTNINDLRSRAREAQREMNRLGREFRQGNIHQSQYAEGTARLSRELRQLEGSQRRITALKTTFGNGMNTAKTAAGYAAVGSAVAATAVAVSSLNTAADFEAQMAKVSAKTEATRAEMEALNKEALRLGATTSLSGSEVAVAMDELAAKGFDATKIISAMPGLIAATEASGEDLALVSDVVTSAINSYGMEATEASRIADVMAMSANKTAAGVGDLGYSFKYAAPVANTLGIKLEELAAATGLLVDKGLAGEQAGTALRMALIRLSKPPAAAEAAMKELNITATDSKDNFKNLTTLAKDWEKATAKLTDTQKVQYAATIFGVEASTAMLSLFESGPEKIKDMTNALENSGGAAAKAAAVMKDNYAGAKEQMFGAIESAQIALATPSLEVLKDTFDGVSSMIEKNMGGIEKAGEVAANILRDITAPFSTTKPIKPKIEPNMDPADAQRMINEYNKQMQKYELFNDMGFGEKVEYMLNTAIEKAEAWLGGSGGEAMGRIFTQLGTIAGKAWIAGLTGATTGAVSSALEGNMSGALGLGAAAWMMGGGTLVKGAVGAGRWGMDKFRNRRSGSPSAATVTPPTSTTNSTSAATPAPVVGPQQTGTITPYRGAATTPAPSSTTASTTTVTTSRGAGLMGRLGSAGKFIGKGFAPLGLALGAAEIYRSSDKVKTGAETAGGWAGGLGGAKVGAAIGTAIAPGVGTALGGLLGGAVGYFGGKWLGGKAVDTVRGGSEASKAPPTPSPKKESSEATKSIDATKLNASMAQFTTTLDTANTSFTTMNTSISAFKTSTDLSTSNMITLATSIGQATGWINSIQGIQPAVNGVIAALNGLKARIDNAQVPTGGGATSRRTAYE
ncbi:phage tail tape measure protein [Lysinibacillus irui]|uniref:Phage tail tape measure protein n=1 Tax=Lysinibacillus irui TaxID=2998077 RepID=A0ABU5NT73_9BACI|nr:phage tail tape measure protein [Lysinibacillus irui]MEA0556454.1 phage tail tape measure protein [Lysinibacillus irui]MEA0979181.1 phage tail tape measure protein [Lysinibacillus irui]MEA1045335.1 phage tail tape measure protein [Lysinibacillus irui]